MKRNPLSIATVALLTGCTASVAIASEPNNGVMETAYVVSSLLETVEKQHAADLEASSRHVETTRKVLQQQRSDENQALAMEAVRSLEPYVGNNRYVYSGSTPSGWDCSGLVMWTYEQMGIQLPHSATDQGNLGTKVDEPRIGDVVVFGYPGRKDWYHSAIYIGDGKAIHAGFKPGKLTEEIDIYGPYFAGHRVEFRRFLD